MQTFTKIKKKTSAAQICKLVSYVSIKKNLDVKKKKKLVSVCKNKFYKHTVFNSHKQVFTYNS